MEKLPVYFEATGSIGITVQFLDKKVGKIVHHLLAECPDEMRQAVNQNSEHFKTKRSGYELKNGKYVVSEVIVV